ncbi:sodium:proton antiporter [Pelomyxa schiedti]|nr:sodium:proton antiporter [Pelomyxa schiedti]
MGDGGAAGVVMDENVVEECVVTTTFGVMVSCTLLCLMIYTLPKTIRLWNIPVFIVGILLSLTSLGVIVLIKELDPYVIVLVFLPPILFQSGLEIDFHIFKRLAFQAILLAGPGVLVSAAITAIMAKYLFIDYNWGWAESFLLGAALSATDPVSTIATVKKLKASPRLSVLIEGEALLNDGTAFVLFSIVESAMIENSVNALDIFVSFMRLTVGGPLFGLAVGIATYLWLRTLRKKPILEITILMIAVFSTMFLSEWMDTSGVLAVVTLGLWMAYKGKFGLSPNTLEPNSVVWEELEYIINSLIFFFSGVIVYHSLSVTNAWDWVNMLILFIALQISRAVAILLLWPALRYTGYGFNYKKFIMLWSAGLRGGVSLSLALFVSNNTEFDPTFRLQFVTQVIGTVFLTSIINGIAAKPLYQLLKFEQFNPNSVALFSHALRDLENDTSAFIKQLETQSTLSKVEWYLINSGVPQMIGDDEELSVKIRDWVSAWKSRLREVRSEIFFENVEEEKNRAESSSHACEEASDSEGAILARALFVRLIKANIMKEHESAGHLAPGRIMELIGLVDETSDDPAHIFQLTRTELHKMFYPKYLCPLLPGVPVFHPLTVFFTFKRLRRILVHCNSLLKCFNTAAQTVQAETGIGFEKQLKDLTEMITHELTRLRGRYRQIYWLAVHSIALVMVLHYKKEKLDELMKDGFIDEKTRDFTVKCCNKVSRGLHSIPLIWKFWPVLSLSRAEMLLLPEEPTGAKDSTDLESVDMAASVPDDDAGTVKMVILRK